MFESFGTNCLFNQNIFNVLDLIFTEYKKDRTEKEHYAINITHLHSTMQDYYNETGNDPIAKKGKEFITPFYNSYVENGIFHVSIQKHCLPLIEKIFESFDMHPASDSNRLAMDIIDDDFRFYSDSTHGNVGNKNAAKEVTKDSTIIFRCPSSVKGKAVRSASSKKMKLQDFLIQLIEENC